ncbi:hypothetical protein CCR75_005338 [Bremia lactucae]|uniref:Uncharacterized protein n=1 Tax=Bremia lactucae TaxID=4779 RepID=A0A976ICU8_BRELC|nr:hypothetical protein CCR75_005338 [Bremia lactucae]
MTHKFHGCFWSVVAVAGTVTAAVVFYKYASRRNRESEESELHTATEMQIATECQECEECITDDESEEKEDLDNSQKMLLATFGLMLMVLVTIVSSALPLSYQFEDTYFMEIPLFQPLLWIAAGIFQVGSKQTQW